MSNKNNDSDKKDIKANDKKTGAIVFVIVAVFVIILIVASMFGGDDSNGSQESENASNNTQGNAENSGIEGAADEEVLADFTELYEPLNVATHILLKEGNSNALSEISKTKNYVDISASKIMQNTNPLSMDASYTGDIFGMEILYNSLGSYNERGLIVPDMADSWEYSEDGLSIEVTLKDNLNFSDGTEITAEEIVKNYVVYMDPSVSGAYANNLTVLDGYSSYKTGRTSEFTSVELLSNGNILFKFSDSTYKNMNVFLTPIIKTEDLMEFSYGGVMAGIYETVDFQAVGSGSYVANSLNSSNTWLSINDNYAGEGTPVVPQFKITVTNDDVVTDFFGREITDIYKFSYNLPLINYVQAQSGLSLYAVSGSSIDYMGFNLDTELGGNLNLRKAIAYGVDRNAIVDSVYDGYAEIPATMTVNSAYIVPNGVETYDYNVDTAKSLIEEEGYTLNSNGFYEKNGTVLKVTIISLDSSSYNLTTESISKSLSEIGIDSNVEPLKFSDLRSRLYGEDDFDLYIAPETIHTITSSFERFLSTSQSNIENWQDEVAQELLSKALNEVDDATRQQLFFQYINILNDSVPVLPLCASYDFVAVSGIINNIEPDSFRPYTWNVENWTMDFAN